MSSRTLIDLLRAEPYVNDVAVTSCGRTDGGGTQALATLSAMFVAATTGCRYVHSPFRRVSHVEGDPVQWALKWESFLNLGAGETPISRDAALVRAADFLADPDRYAGRRIVVHAPRFQDLLDPHLDIYGSMRPILLRKYDAAAKTGLPLHRRPGCLMVGIHVRRGDVSSAPERRRGRFTPDDAVLRALDDVQAAAAGRPIDLHLYSEGPISDFARFAEAGCTLHLDTDAFETLHNLAQADLLVMARGYFSYLAGLLNRGIVLYEAFAPPPLEHWIVRARNGTSDRSRLRSEITSAHA